MNFGLNYVYQPWEMPEILVFVIACSLVLQHIVTNIFGSVQLTFKNVTCIFFLLYFNKIYLQQT